MENPKQIDLRATIRLGLIAGLVAVSLSMIGMIELLSGRDLIANVLTLGQVFLFAAPIAMAYQAIRYFDTEENRNQALIHSGLAGLAAALPLVLLIVLATNLDIRQFLPNVSPALVDILTFGMGAVVGSIVLLVISTIVGILTAVVFLLPEQYRRPLLNGLLYTLIIGVFSENLAERLRTFFGAGFSKFLFAGKSMKLFVAIGLFLIVIGFTFWWDRKGKDVKSRFAAQTPQQATRNKQISRGLLIGFLLILPILLGSYLSEVTNNVLIYVLMGFGLNIVVGFAGLLDLGYVAFFAIGAYVMALLTSSGGLAIANISFWLALPICVLVAVLFGVSLGIPVLRMRGDYLAIVTLGFGEIIRILALSDLLKPFIGGAQGILGVGKPIIFGQTLVKPNHFYYVILAGVLLAAFVSWRLSESRLGRQWMALREDEDVAEAMGINLVGTKLLAFGIGAGFSGLSGAIFASKLTSIFPHSFNLLVSINVLSLIIVGGMGSLPGVVVGALILVGLPELLREFAEYRMLMYGALLIVMMLSKPEGFLPSQVRKRELHRDDEPGLEELQAEA